MSRRTHTLVLAGLAALATVSLSACGSLDGSAHAAASAPLTATAPATTSATPALVAAAPAGTAQGGTGTPRGTGGGTGSGGGGTNTGGGSGTGGSNTGGGGTTGGSGGGGGTSAPTPKITSFKVKQQPTCPVHGTPDAPFSAPGTDVVIAWTVTGADGAAIAVDNPGTYGAYGSNYPASGDLSLPFGCNDGTTTTHSYTVWPAGAHSVSKTLTVSAHSDN